MTYSSGSINSDSFTDGRHEDYDRPAVDQTVKFELHPPQTRPIQVEIKPDHVLLQASPGSELSVVYGTDGVRVFVKTKHH